MRLTPETDPESVKERLKAARSPRRLSEARADRLQRDARIRTGRWDLAVRVEADHPPAALRGTDSGPEIVVSGDPVPQPVTDYGTGEWHLLVQRVRVAHEVGHLTYSDPADFEDRLAGVDSGFRPVARAIWNALEDVAVEAAIRDRWANSAAWFGAVRANLLAGVGPGIDDPSGGFVYPLVHAAVVAILDGRAVETDTLSRLLDPAEATHHFHSRSDRERFVTQVVGPVTEAATAVGDLAEPAARNRLAIECFESIRPAVANAAADGRGQVAARPDVWGMPDDTDRGRPAADADPLELEHSPDREHAPPSPAADGQTSISAAGDGPEVVGTPPAEDPEEQETAPEADSEEGRLEDLAAELAAGDRPNPSIEDRAETLQNLQAAVSAAETELESEEVVVPSDDPSPHEPTARAAREDGTRLARVLRNRFQTERKRSFRRTQRRGRLDPAALHRAATGDRRVKQRRERPEETDHRCLFVLDRSGSMRQHVRVAERAMGMLAVALEAVDVEVSVLELLDKAVRLAKPADRSVERAAGRLYHGDAGGGTPLTDTLHIAREYLKYASGSPFVIVVTDGRPAEPDRYREALHRFTVPVLGVNLTTEQAAGESEFHRQVTVPPETRDLRRALRQLVQEVLFE
ncbi:MAG: VWA domain-containing protein [Halodesulfurarchaeum sp.]